MSENLDASGTRERSKRKELIVGLTVGALAWGAYAAVYVMGERIHEHNMPNLLKKLNEASGAKILKTGEPFKDGTGSLKIDAPDCKTEGLILEDDRGKLYLKADDGSLFWFANDHRGEISQSYDHETAREIAVFLCDIPSINT